MRGECLFVALTTVFVYGQSALAAPPPTSGGDIPTQFTRDTSGYDYVKREVAIPMRDGAKLHTLIVIPKSATAGNAPILLTRTPYSADQRIRAESPHMDAVLPQGDDVI